MTQKAQTRIVHLHWKLFFPLVGLLWLIIAIVMGYTVIHEHQRLRQSLDNRLLNVNATVIEAYERGGNLQECVDFIKLFTDKTTLETLHLTVYDDKGDLLADNEAPTIQLHDKNGNPIPELANLHNMGKPSIINTIELGGQPCMFSVLASPDGHVRSYAALPYEGSVSTFLRIDPMVWVVVVALGSISSIVAYLGLKAVCRNVYNLRDFANAIKHDEPIDVSNMRFSDDELGEVSRTLMDVYRDKLTAIESKSQHERQISHNINHELKTPVGIVKGYIDTIISDPEMPAEIRENFMRRAQENIDRMATLIKDISEITNLDITGVHNSISIQPVSISELVSEMASDVRIGKLAGTLEFNYNIPSDCKVMANSSLLTNSFLNLIYNAARYSGGTDIWIDFIGASNGITTLKFCDNGKGVDESHLPHLFEAFYRVDKGRSRRVGGSGLGLNIVRKAIEAMGGSISVNNRAGGGLEYTISLVTA